MDLNEKTKLHDLLVQYPFLLDFLVNYNQKFAQLKNPVARNTIARIADLKAVAHMGDIPVEVLITDLECAISEGSGGAPSAEEKARKEALKSILRELHAGAKPEELRPRFAEVARGVTSSEIARVEQELVAEGMDPTEIKRLCDVHVLLFQDSLEGQERPDVMPGHPVHTMRAENAALAESARRFDSLIRGLDANKFTERKDAIGAELSRLSEVEKHYLRKEYLLFPALEKHGISAPPQVMWAVHDDVRANLKMVKEALESGDIGRLDENGIALTTAILEMVNKEESILFPMALDVLSDEEWAQIGAGESGIGYALVRPGDAWKPAGSKEAKKMPEKELLNLETGALSLKQVNLLLTHLPLDITFVDENDEVRYYSEGAHRIFPRSPGVIGRRVQNCHPPKSVDKVEQILRSFKEGKRDVAEFWLTLEGRFIYIRYFALRDRQGNYRGTLEVSQDITGIRKLEGEHRLLDWEQEA